MDNQLYYGGPVGSDVHVLHPYSQVEGALEITPGVYHGGNLEHASDLVEKGDADPTSFHFFVGCSAWDLEQLDEELADNIWILLDSSRCEDANAMQFLENLAPSGEMCDLDDETNMAKIAVDYRLWRKEYALIEDVLNEHDEEMSMFDWKMNKSDDVGEAKPALLQVKNREVEAVELKRMREEEVEEECAGESNVGRGGQEESTAAGGREMVPAGGKDAAEEGGVGEEGGAGEEGRAGEDQNEGEGREDGPIYMEDLAPTGEMLGGADDADDFLQEHRQDGDTGDAPLGLPPAELLHELPVPPSGCQQWAELMTKLPGEYR
jgi:hypothetical protein